MQLGNDVTLSIKVDLANVPNTIAQLNALTTALSNWGGKEPAKNVDTKVPAKTKGAKKVTAPAQAEDEIDFEEDEELEDDEDEELEDDEDEELEDDEDEETEEDELEEEMEMSKKEPKTKPKKNTSGFTYQQVQQAFRDTFKVLFKKIKDEKKATAKLNGVLRAIQAPNIKGIPENKYRQVMMMLKEL